MLSSTESKDFHPRSWPLPILVAFVYTIGVLFLLAVAYGGDLTVAGVSGPALYYAGVATAAVAWALASVVVIITRKRASTQE